MPQMTVGVLAVVVAGALGASTILLIGWLKARRTPPDGSQLVRALLEILGLYLLSILPVVVLVTFPDLDVAGLEPKQREQFTGGLYTLARLSHLYLLPLWFAIRLPVDTHRQSKISRAASLFNITAYLVVLLGAGCVSSLFLGGPHGLQPSFELALAGSSTIGFVLIHSLIGVVTLASQRSVDLRPPPSHLKTKPVIRHVLGIALLGAAIPWFSISNLVVQGRTDLLFVPAASLEAARMLGLTPVSQLDWVLLSSFIPPLIILFSGLLAIYSGRTDDALLFGLLCLLQLLWGLDVYPWWGGRVLWSLDMLAACWTLPVLIHLFLLLPGDAIRLPRRAPRALVPLYVVFLLASVSYALLTWQQVFKQLFDGTVQPALIPIAGMSGAIISGSIPVAWSLSVYCAWTAGSKLSQRSEVETPTSGCRWLDRIDLRGDVLRRRREVLSRQAKILALGLALTAILLILWLLLLPIWLSPGYAVLGNILIKVWVAAFYIFMLSSILRLRLWGISKVTATVFTFALLLWSLRGIKSLGLSFAANTLVLVLGLVAFPLIEWVSLNLGSSDWLYRRLFPDRHRWQAKLREATEVLAEPGSRERRVKQSLEIASDRPGSYGGWILSRNTVEGPHAFELQRLSHSETCTGACVTRLIEALTERTETRTVRLRESLARALHLALEDRRALDVGRASTRASLRDGLRRMLGFVHDDDPLDLATLDTLAAAKVTLLLPLGGSSVRWILVVSGEVEPSGYDVRDHRALSIYCKEMSIAMAPSAWPDAGQGGTGSRP